MNEAKITALMMQRKLEPTGAWEVKITKARTLPFSKFQDNQIHALLQVKKQRFSYKIRDEGISKKPFDGFTLDKSPAWCICFFLETMNGYIIDIEKFYEEMRASGKKSLTEQSAKLICYKVIHI